MHDNYLNRGDERKQQQIKPPTQQINWFIEVKII